MTSEMTAKERLEAALENRPVDYLPFSPFLAYLWSSLDEATQRVGPLAYLQRVGATPLWRGAPCPVKAIPPELRTRSFEENGRTVTETVTPVGTLREARKGSDSGNTSFLIEHSLKEEEDFKVLTWIEEHTKFEIDREPVENHLNGAGGEGLSIGMLIPRCKSAYQSLVEHHVGTEELIYALEDYPETVDALWRVMVENDLQAVRLAMEADCYDYYLTWEDSSTQNYSPAQYDRFIGAEIREWCKTLAAHGKRYVQHACGHVKDLVGRMKDTGACAVESISPPPTGNVTIAEARAAVGGDFGIIGGIEPTAFLNLSLEELGPYCEQVIAEGRGGPFVLANSDSCPPGVTEEKMRLMAEVAKGYR